MSFQTVDQVQVSPAPEDYIMANTFKKVIDRLMWLQAEIERLTEENDRLLDLVSEAYDEGYEDGEDEDRGCWWETTKAYAALQPKEDAK